MPEPIDSAPNDAAKRTRIDRLEALRRVLSDPRSSTDTSAARLCRRDGAPELPPVTSAALRRGETERFSIFRWNKILEATFCCNPRKTKPTFPNLSSC